MALFIAVVPAWAALGQSEQSVVADQQNLGAHLHTAVLRDYRVHEMSRPDGSKVREFVSPAGKVFGVAWQGPVMPNLSQVLGSYYAQYQAAPRSPRTRRGPMRIQVGDLVVESSGHMRSFRGRAYLNSMMPANVTQEVIQ
jgi:hypothetical protein